MNSRGILLIEASTDCSPRFQFQRLFRFKPMYDLLQLRNTGPRIQAEDDNRIVGTPHRKFIDHTETATRSSKNGMEPGRFPVAYYPEPSYVLWNLLRLVEEWAIYTATSIPCMHLINFVLLPRSNSHHRSKLEIMWLACNILMNSS